MSVWLSSDGQWGVEIVGDFYQVWQWANGSWNFHGKTSDIITVARMVDLSLLDEYTPDNLIHCAVSA